MFLKSKAQTVKVIRAYPVRFGGYDLVVPVGARVSNVTSCGPDNNYRFWQDFHEQARAVTGFPNSLLSYDLTHYGVNVPAEYCEPWKAEV